MAKIAIMGHGVVGSGVAELLRKNSTNISQRIGQSIEISKILDLREFKNLPYSDLFTKNFDDILKDDEISVVVETIGGLNPSYEFTKSLLKSGKSVVSSNKELVAQKGDELLSIAKKNHVNYLFEASVGGGVPIIRPIYSCLAANKIEYICGILNGTTNFIITKMLEDGLSFEESLALAKDKGYAEKDPTDDINGADSNRKICILASLAYGTHIYPHEVCQSGIECIELADVDFARSIGCVIKLIGKARRLENGKISIMVCPAFVSNSSKLASVSGVYNAILVKGDAVGEVLFVGQGAGKMPTASAVVADIIRIVRAGKTFISQFWKPSNGSTVQAHEQYESRFYLRLKARDAKEAREFVLKNYKSPVFLSRPGQPADEIALTTGNMLESEIKCLADLFSSHRIKQLSKLIILN